MAVTGSDILEFGHKADIGKAAKIVSDRACLTGNPDTAAVLLQEIHEQVRAVSL